MSSSRQSRRRHQQRSLRRHQLRLEGLEKRYALDGTPDTSTDEIFPLLESLQFNGVQFESGAVSHAFTVLFSESVTGVDGSDFEVVTTGGAVAAAGNPVVTGTGSTYTVLVAVSGEGQVGVNVIDNGSIRDLSNNPLRLSLSNFSFSPQATFSTGASPRALRAADFNQDGNLDIIVSPHDSNNQLDIFFGNGAGSFTRQVIAFANNNNSMYPDGFGKARDVAVADLNNDGFPDIAVADDRGNNTYNKCIWVKLNNGDGTFQASNRYGLGDWPRSIDFGDVNNDGALDMLVGTVYGAYLKLNNGSGSFGGTITVEAYNTIQDSMAQTMAPTYSSDVQFTDANGDGKLDVVGISTLRLRLGNGDGTFQPATQHPTITGRRAGTNADTRQGTMRFDVGDVNNDGLEDLVLPTSDSTVAFVFGNNESPYQSVLTYDGAGDAYSVANEDFDGDGFIETIAANHVTNTVLINSWGYSGESQGEKLVINVGRKPHAVITGDWNNDGRSDIAVVNLDDSTLGVLTQENNQKYIGQVVDVQELEDLNKSPTLDEISDVSINEDDPEQTISLTGITAGLGETQVLAVTTVSDTINLIPDPTVDFDGQSSTGTLKFTPVADQFGTATITVTVEDGGLDNDLATQEDNQSISRAVTIDVTSVNDPPVLYVAVPPQFPALPEDSGAPSGTVGSLVRDLIGIRYFDVEGDPPGIAVTGTNLQGGTLWYSEDNGSSWFEVGAVAESLSKLLAADAHTRLYFQPLSGFSGSIENVFTFRGWDNRASVQIIGSRIDSSVDNQGFGNPVVISGSGDTVAAAFDNSSDGLTPAVSVKRWSQINNEWVDASTGLDAHFQGNSNCKTALSFDGKTLAMSKPYHESPSRRGVAAVFNWNATTSSWEQRGSLLVGLVDKDRFGSDIMLSSDGNTLAIGSDGWFDLHGHQGIGNVKVFQWSDEASDWIQRGTTITAATADDGTGRYISLSSDGNTVSIGAPFTSEMLGNVGNVRIYRWNSDDQDWYQVGDRIVGKAQGENIGRDLSMSSDGNTLVIGAQTANSNSGLVRVYEWNQVPGSASWLQIGQDIVGEGVAESFGESVDISSSGKKIVIGASYERNQYHTGAANVYQWNENTETWFLEDMMDGDHGGDKFGRSVGMSASGSVLVIGAPRGGTDDSGYVRIFTSVPLEDSLSEAAATVGISITALNVAPTDITLSNSAVGENSQGAIVGLLTTTDHDVGDTFTYTLVPGSGDTDNSLFYIEGDSFRVGTNLDYETSTTANVRIRTTDSHGEYFEKAFVIGVQNYNEPPTDIVLSSSSIEETQLVGSVVGALTSADPDGSGFSGFAESFTYSLTSGTGDTDNSSFEVVADELRTKESFNFEIKDSYSVRVRTEDNMGVPYEKQFVVNISNINDTPTGEVVIDGSPRQNVALSANTSTIQDEDGLGTFAYQWLRDGVPIQDVGSSTHMLTQDDVGSQISVRIDYLDNAGTAESLTSAQASAVMNVNDAPVLDPAASPQLSAVLEDAGAPVGQVGTLVSALIDAGGTHNNFGDVDSDLPAIAITDFNLSSGSLYYSIDDGVTWSEVTAVSVDSALGLYADEATRIYFQPASNFEGTISDVITFQGWDRSGASANGDIGLNTNPPVVGSIDTPGLAYEIALSNDGSIAYLAERDSNLQIFDVSDPNDPNLVGTLDNPHGLDIKLSKDGAIAFIAAWDSGLIIADVQDPTNPTTIGSLDSIGKPIRITLSADENTAYVADWDGNLQIINIVDRESPSLIATLGGFGTAHCVTLSPDGTIAHVSDYYGGLRIVDVSDSSNPAHITSINTTGNPLTHSLSSDGKTAYVAAYYGGLWIVDLSTPENPELISRLDTTSETRWISISEGRNLAYVADWHNGVHLVDISNPAVPEIKATIDTHGANRVRLSLDQSLAYVPDWDKGLKIIDLSQGFSVDSDSVSVDIIPVNDAPTLDELSDVNILEDASEQTVNLTSITAGGGETQSMSVTANSENTGLILDLTVDFDGQSSTGTLKFTPVADQFGTATITVTIEDGGLDGILDTAGDNATFSQTFEVDVTPVNDIPTLDPISDRVFPEESPTQIIDITGITAGGGETQPLQVTVTSSNPSLISDPTITSDTVSVQGSRSLAFVPLTDQYGIATITVTVEDGGLDLDLNTAEDNAIFSWTFDVTVTPDTDEPPSQVTPHGKMFIHETLSGDPLVSYHLPAVNVNGEAINGLLNRITATSSDTALIPDPTVLYASADIPSSLSFTPVANANGTANLSIRVEDGGPDNDFATTEDNRQATHQVEVNVLEVISNQGSAILSKDGAENLYVNTQPVVYHDQQQVQSTIAGFAAIGATSDDGANALLVERASVTNRLVTDDAWRINSLFDSLQNESSPVLDLSAREVSVELNVVAVAGAYEINGALNPTLVVRRGQIYNFNLNVANHPFYLQTTGNGFHPENAFNRFFQGQGRTGGEHMWIVPADAPDELYYQCEFHPVMFGKIIVVD